MRFGTIKTKNACGAVLAHSLELPNRRFKKGAVFTDADINELLDAGVSEVTVAQLDNNDIAEDDATTMIANSLAGLTINVTQAVAGRANLTAVENGILNFNPDLINKINAVDEAITVATLPNFKRVQKGALLATIKIIPYAVAQKPLTRVVNMIDKNDKSKRIDLMAFRSKTFDLIITKTPEFKPSLLAKGRKIIEMRTAPLGLQLKSFTEINHHQDDVAIAIQKTTADMVLILGASATSDRKDVIPAGLLQAGGKVIRYGMPVDPGNLLVYGKYGSQPVLGLPGCARSPALNGTDWVLERLAADIPVSSQDIAQMGVGGLLKEIPNRIQPRIKPAKLADQIQAVLLAAGASRRMGEQDKLLREIDDEPLLRRSVKTALASNIGRLFVVISQQAPEHRRALEGLDVDIITTQNAALGMSASMRAGVSAVTEKAKAILLMFADMPDITPKHINKIIEQHNPKRQQSIICPIDQNGKRGHPVLFDIRYRENLCDITGDRGAKEVLRAVPEEVYEIQLDNAVTLDLDTPQAWAEWEKNKSNT